MEVSMEPGGGESPPIQPIPPHRRPDQMARIGEYKEDTNLRAARENLKRDLMKALGVQGQELARDIEHLIEAKIAANQDKRY
jgi:hypothetical protein